MKKIVTHIFLISSAVFLLMSANCAGIFGVSHARPQARLVITNNTCTGTVYEPSAEPAQAVASTSGQCTLNVALASEPGTRVTVQFASPNPLVSSASRLSFNTSNWSAPQTATINIANDGDPTMRTVPGMAPGMETMEAVNPIDSAPVQLRALAPGYLPQNSRDNDAPEEPACVIQGEECLIGRLSEEAQEQGSFTLQQAYCGTVSPMNALTGMENMAGMENDFFLNPAPMRDDMDMPIPLPPFGTAENPYRIPVQGGCTDLRFQYDPDSYTPANLMVSDGMGGMMRSDGIHFRFLADGNMYEVELQLLEALVASEPEITLSVINELDPASMRIRTERTRTIMQSDATNNVAMHVEPLRGLGTARVSPETQFVINDNTSAEVWESRKEIRLHNPMPPTPPDIDPPVFVSVQPSGTSVNAAEVNATGEIVITFNESILPAEQEPGTTVNITLTDETDGSSTAMFNVDQELTEPDPDNPGMTRPALQVRFERNEETGRGTITLLGVMLEESTPYTIQIPQGVVTDPSLNANEAIEDTTITFTTAPPPAVVPPPAFVSISPMGAVDPATTEITITFDKVIVPGMGDITIAGGGTSTAFEVTDMAQVRITPPTTNIVIFGPMLSLNSNTTYNITMPAGTVRDTSTPPVGNEAILTGTISFTTGAGGGGPVTPPMRSLVVTNNTCSGNADGNIFEPATTTPPTTTSCSMDIALSEAPMGGAAMVTFASSDATRVPAPAAVMFTDTTAQTVSFTINGNGSTTDRAATAITLSANSTFIEAAGNTQQLAQFNYQEAYCGTTSTAMIDGTANTAFFLSGTGTMAAPYTVPVQTNCADIQFLYDPEYTTTATGIFFQFAVNRSQYDVDLTMTEAPDFTGTEQAFFMTLFQDGNNIDSTFVVLGGGGPGENAGDTLNIQGGTAIIDSETLFMVGNMAGSTYTTSKEIRLHMRANAPALETDPPMFMTVTATSLTSIRIEFNEDVRSITSATNTIRIIPMGGGMPSMLDNTQYRTIFGDLELNRGFTLTTGAMYTIEIPAGTVEDIQGNDNLDITGNTIMFTAP